MRLNHDCMRSVLLELEKQLHFDDDMSIRPVSVESLYSLEKYEAQDILYSVKMLSEAGYIKASLQYAGGTFVGGVVSDISYQGHEFLEYTRNQTRWKKVKDIAGKVGSASLPIMLETAKALVMESAINLV